MPKKTTITTPTFKGSLEGGVHFGTALTEKDSESLKEGGKPPAFHDRFAYEIIGRPTLDDGTPLPLKRVGGLFKKSKLTTSEQKTLIRLLEKLHGQFRKEVSGD